MFCTKCGRQLAESAVACPACGQQKIIRQRKKSNTLIILVSIVMGAVVGVLALIWTVGAVIVSGTVECGHDRGMGVGVGARIGYVFIFVGPLAGWVAGPAFIAWHRKNPKVFWTIAGACLLAATPVMIKAATMDLCH